MAELQREARLGRLSVELVNTLTTDFDLNILLDKLLAECKDLLDISEAGLVLADEFGALHVMAATTESAEHIEALQVQADEGPAIKAFHGGEVVVVLDIEDCTQWPRFQEIALRNGYQAVHAIPLRVGENPLGAMCLFSYRRGNLNEVDALAGQALADIASIGIMNYRSYAKHETIVSQLQAALDSRVLIEQAKGVIASTQGVSIDEAFALLRRFARDRGLRIHDVAARVISAKGLGVSEDQSDAKSPGRAMILGETETVVRE
jgi:transcriptional regulator with GAF, ATPase, and Fis domain